MWNIPLESGGHAISRKGIVVDVGFKPDVELSRYIVKDPVYPKGLAVGKPRFHSGWLSSDWGDVSSIFTQPSSRISSAMRFPRVYSSMESVGLPGSPLLLDYSVSTSKFIPSKIGSLGSRVDVGVSPVYPTISKTGFRMMGGYALAYGAVSLGFLEFLEEGTGIVHPRWKTDVKQDRKSLVGLGSILESDVSLDLSIDIGEVSAVRTNLSSLNDIAMDVTSISRVDVSSMVKTSLRQSQIVKNVSKLKIKKITKFQTTRYKHYDVKPVFPSVISPSISSTIPVIPLFDSGSEELVDMDLVKKRKHGLFGIFRWRIHPVEVDKRLYEVDLF